MENKFVKFSQESDWSGYTFLVTCVSVGNIGQLSTDLLISTLPNTQKAGYLISNLVQPIVGHDPFVQNSRDLSLSCESNSNIICKLTRRFFKIKFDYLSQVFENKDLKIVLLQQRAPLFKGKRNEFVQLLCDFVQNEKFSQVICLTSSHAYERLDSQLSGFDKIFNKIWFHYIF